jgi:hypothetical protein
MRDTLYIHLGSHAPAGTVEWTRAAAGAEEFAVACSPLEEVAGRLKSVPLDHPWVASARRVGTCLGE